ncbi:MAG: hypothetical protein MJZ56_01335 [Bacteroidales bacterium]|nr:hypothetical protein [Bacteroidales bacterium]
MRNIIKISMSAILALGFAYAARSQACGGINNTITDKHTSSALGQSNRVYGQNSTAIGLENIVSKSDSKNDYAFAIGYKNYATAKLTFAFGDQNTVSQINSIGIGRKNNITGANSFAIGNNNTVNSDASIAIGYKIKNTTGYGITIGYGRNTTDKVLLNNTDGIMMGMNSDKPTLFISWSETDGRTGRVGIGNVTEPQAKLHIKADNYSYDGEDADIMLEPTRSDKKAAVYFRNKNNSISVSGNQMIFAAPKYSFTNADITLGKNTSTQASEISFTGQGGISMSDNRMNFNAREYNFANGAIHAEEVVVEIMRDWPDYVFNDDYQLTSLNEVKKYIDDNGHLPGVPSAEQVSEEGVKLGEINTKLLEKIEELTLYIIRQEERIQALENQLDSITKN